MATAVSRTPILRDSAELEPLIQEERTKCTSLGLQLKIPLSVLQEFEKQSKEKNPIRQCYAEMWKQWLDDKEGDRKWNEIFEALKQQRNNRLKTNLEKKYKADTQVQPDTNFEKELKEMMPKWYQFGCALGVSTTDLDIIKEGGDSPEKYMLAMLKEWMTNHEDDYTWETLQEGLRVIGNRRLAANLEEHRLKDRQDGGSELPSQEPSTIEQDGDSEPAEKKTKESEEYDKLLDIEDLVYVLEQLANLDRSKFFDLGLVLGLKAPTLNNLEYSSSRDELWRNIMKAWLNQEDYVQPTWRALIKALESDLVNRKAIAQKIRDWLNNK